MLADGMLDDDEKTGLMETLNQFARRDFELGEILQSTSLPLDTPAPVLTFPGQRYCFTGTFNFGCRRDCEEVVEKLGAEAGTLTQRTHVLVVGIYATDSWRHSSFGNKTCRACGINEIAPDSRRDVKVGRANST
jgi:hypothetical protein